ncbi:MAG TPA: TetR family transcriptional regulator [Euzebyales bacterium]|nr:TetR family transcriptional regulator [Euzebyales bacterium]
MRSDDALRDEDRTTKARIRDAAITLFADSGVAATSVRAIAAAAQVSPALVIHHFGSKDALRVACDEHIAEVLREQKGKSLRAGPGMDVVAALREVRGGPPLSRYLARTLIDGTPHVAEIIDEMVTDGVKYMAEGVESGVLRPTAFPYERTAVLSIWTLGALVLHEHLERLIGVDILTYPPEDPADAWPYVGPLIEMMTEGVVTAEAAEQMRDALGPKQASATNEEDDGS